MQQKQQPQPSKGAAAAGNGSGSGRRILQSHPTTGVFVGASYAEWSLLQQQHRVPQSTYTASGSGLSVLAGRISYMFGWCGPATVTDTACSSSLVALSSAHNCLQVMSVTLQSLLTRSTAQSAETPFATACCSWESVALR